MKIYGIDAILEKMWTESEKWISVIHIPPTKTITIRNDFEWTKPTQNKTVGEKRISDYSNNRTIILLLLPIKKN